MLLTLPVTERTVFLKFSIPKNSVFEDQEIFPKINKKSSKKNSRGCAPHPLLTGLRPSRPGAFCLFAGLLGVHDRGDRLLERTLSDLSLGVRETDG